MINASENYILYSIPPDSSGGSSGKIPSTKPKREESTITSSVNTIYREPLKGQVHLHPSFKGSFNFKALSEFLWKEVTVNEEKSAREIYKGVKNYLQESSKLSIEAAISQNRKEKVFIAKNIGLKFGDALYSPVKAILQSIENRGLSKEAKAAIKKREEVLINLVGLHNFVEKTKKANPKITKKELTKKISEYEAKLLNRQIQNYGAQTSQWMNRGVTGSLTAWFIGSDFNNLRRLQDDNAHEAKKEGLEKFKQQELYIGLATVLTYFTNMTLKNFINSSLPFTFVVGSLNTVATQALSRKLTGRPVLPVKKHDDPASNTNKSCIAVKGNSLNKSDKIFAQFSSKKTSFKGLPPGVMNQVEKMTAETMTGEGFSHVFRFLKHVNPLQSEQLFNDILKKNKHITEKQLKKVINGKSQDIEKIIIGKSNFHKFCNNLKDAVLMPVTAVLALAKMSVNGIAKLIGKEPVFKKKAEAKGLSEIYVKNIQKYMQTIKKQLNQEKITDHEFVESLEKNNSHSKKVKKLFGDLVTKFSSEKASYSGAAASTLIKLTSGASVPFFFWDAYNTVKNSNGSEEKAREKAKERAAQDLTRQVFSLWIVNALNKIFENVINHSLLGLLAVSAGSVTLYETLTRTSCGSPVLPKTKAKLEKIEEDNEKKKGLAGFYMHLMKRLTGKKSIKEKAAEAASSGKSNITTANQQQNSINIKSSNKSSFSANSANSPFKAFA